MAKKSAKATRTKSVNPQKAPKADNATARVAGKSSAHASGRAALESVIEVRVSAPTLSSKASSGTPAEHREHLNALRRALSNALLAGKRTTTAAKVQEAAMTSLTLPEKRQKTVHGMPNIHGVGMGYKIVEGTPTPTLCLRVYVQKKLPLSALSDGELLPKEFAGIPIDVIENPSPAFRLPPRPLRPS